MFNNSLIKYEQRVWQIVIIGIILHFIRLQVINSPELMSQSHPYFFLLQFRLQFLHFPIISPKGRINLFRYHQLLLLRSTLLPHQSSNLLRKQHHQHSQYPHKNKNPLSYTPRKKKVTIMRKYLVHTEKIISSQQVNQQRQRNRTNHERIHLVVVNLRTTSKTMKYYLTCQKKRNCWD